MPSQSKRSRVSESPPDEGRNVDEDAYSQWLWVNENREGLAKEYAGRWIAVCDRRVVGVGISLATALKQAVKKGYMHPFVTGFVRRETQDIQRVAHWI